MNKRLTKINVLQLGIVLGILLACVGLIFLPFLLLGAVAGALGGSNGQGGIAAGFSLVFAILIPIFYGIFGFIQGVIMGFVYNLVAKWTGGLEFTVVDVQTPGSLGYPQGMVQQ